jgi:hypothetical protein
MNKGIRTGLTYSQLFSVLFRQLNVNRFTHAVIADIYDLCDEVGKRSNMA